MNLERSAQANKASSVNSFLPRGILQRKCACGTRTSKTDECGLCKKKRMSLQRRTADNLEGKSEIPSIVYDVLRTPGTPLDSATRSFMEPYFGHDFSRVRVHNDSQAAESAKMVDAQAFTVGDHIVFGNGQHNPGSSVGVGLVAHELTHVVQQQRGKVGSESGIGSSKSVHEQEADRYADRASQLASTMRFSNIGQPSISGGNDSKIREGEDSQMSIEPPDPRFLYAVNGETTCTFPAGTATVTIHNAACTRPCTTRHEGVHQTDIAPCCTKAGRAHSAAATAVAKRAVETRFFSWMGGNRSWFECRAYAESVRCADGLLTAKNCSGPPAAADAACCATLASYRADKETRRVSNCAAAGTLSACPFA